MKINRLTIQNFRNHINTTVELDWLNIFVGAVSAIKRGEGGD